MKRNLRRLSLAALALSFSAVATAKEDATPGYGAQTRGWLELQKSEAGKAPARGLPGEAADRVYQRYLQSFTRPIPERFERERTGNGDMQR